MNTSYDKLFRFETEIQAHATGYETLIDELPSHRCQGQYQDKTQMLKVTYTKLSFQLSDDFYWSKV